MVTKGYRPDIDGLRAIAVLSVVFFHVGYDAFSGGYVGVDVFFVISGFLITRLIYAQIQSGGFRFSNFYVRRARRLFPALFTTLVATFTVGIILYSPANLAPLSRAVVYTVLSVSNFLFWRESGYFDADAVDKPLLHTWSLSVEEQFYLVWPLSLVLLIWLSRRTSWGSERLRAWTVPVFLVLAGTASLVFTEITLRTDAAAAFFLAPFRVTEFAIGAIMVWLVDRTPSNRVLLEPLVVIGLALIAYPVFAYTEDTVFPGFNAMPPCIGTAILIYAGTAARLGRLLNNRITVGIGLISYSLYLVHWPLYVFYRYSVLRPLQPLEQAGIVIASVALATAMYFWIELPFRRVAGKPGAWSPAVFGLACACLAVILIVPASAAWLQRGWPSRLPAEVRVAASNLSKKRQDTWKIIRPIEKKTAFSGGETKVLVIGDSHAKDVTNALMTANERLGGRLEVIPRFISFYCQPFIGPREVKRHLSQKRINSCNAAMRKLIDGDLIRQADYVIFSARWTDLGVDHIKDTIERIKGRTDARIVILGRTAEFTSVPELLVQFGRLRDFGTFIVRARTDLSEINDRLRAIAEQTDVAFRDKGGLVCPTAESCDVLDDRNALLIYDYGHWTLAGAAFYGNRMVDTGFFEFLRK